MKLVGIAAVQFAYPAGHAVMVFVDGQHSGHDKIVDMIKGLASEPGTADPEEYVICKANFRDLLLILDLSALMGHPHKVRE